MSPLRLFSYLILMFSVGMLALPSVYAGGPVPIVYSVTPSSVPINTGATTITVKGSNLSGAAVTINGTSLTGVVAGSSSLTAVIPASLLTNPGTSDVIVTTPAGPSVADPPYDSFAVVPPVPTVTGVSPAQIPTGSPTTTVTITGTNFTGATAVQSLPGTSSTSPFTNIVVVNPTTLTATINYQYLETPSVQDLTVTTAGGTSVANNPADLLSVVNPVVPSVISISPASTPVGSSAVTVTITAANATGIIGATWNGTALTNITVLSPTTVSGTIPASALGVVTTGYIVLTTPYGSSAGSDGEGSLNGPTAGYDTFSVTGPTVSAVSPTSVDAGSASTQITLTGTGFTNSSVVTWNGVTLINVSASGGSSLTATIPASALTTITAAKNIRVTTGTATSPVSAEDLFSVAPSAPSVTSVSPTSIPVGSFSTQITIIGTTLTGATAVTWDGVSASIQTVSSTQVTATFPASALTQQFTGPVTVTTPSGPSTGVSPGDQLSVVASVLPSVTNISPGAVPAGSGSTTISITGTNLTGTTAVNWNGFELTNVVNVSSTSVTAVLPTGDLVSPFSGDVTVTTASGTSLINPNGDTFAVTPLVPTVTSVRPSTIPTGTTPVPVTITGANLGGATSVQWNGASITPTSVTPGQIIFTLPKSSIYSASTGDVQVTTGGGQSSANPPYDILSVTGPSIPLITSFSPTTILAESPATTVILSGSAFTGATSVVWNGNTFTKIIVPNDNTIVVSIPAADLTGAANSPFSVNIPGETGVSSGSFSVTLGAASGPTVTAVSPSSSSVSPVGSPVTITGTNFSNVTSVYWGATALTNINVVNPTTITAVFPDVAYSASAADIQVVANTFESPVNAPGDLFAYDPTGSPVVTSVSPSSTAIDSLASTIAITGYNFTPTSTVTWNGNVLSSITDVSSTMLTAVIPALDLFSFVNNGEVTVTNGVVSSSANAYSVFSVNEAAPTVTSVAPLAVPTGSATTTVTILGTNFFGATSVNWDNYSFTPTIISDSKLTISVPAADLTAEVTDDVTVVGPGGTSAATFADLFSVNGPAAPIITSIVPGSVVAGSANTTITINGSGFTNASAVVWNGYTLTNYNIVSDNTITAVVPAADLTVVESGDVQVTAFTITSLQSPNDVFATFPPDPIVTSLSVSQVSAGAAAQQITITGSGFTNVATVSWNGNALTGVTFVNSTELIGTIPAADLVTPASAQIVVTENGVSSTGSYPGDLFTVGSLTPAVTAVSPSSLPLGSPATTITVTGTGLNSASIISWNGHTFTPISDSATQITFTIPQADLSTAASTDVRVTTVVGQSSATAADILTVSAPEVTSVSPASIQLNSQTTVVTVNGIGLYGATSVTWNGYTFQAPAISVINGGAGVTVTIPSADLTATIAAPVVVRANGLNSTNGGSDTLAVVTDLPTVTTLSPSWVVAGANTPITITGANFTPASTVTSTAGTFSNVTYLSATQITAILATPSGTPPLSGNVIVTSLAGASAAATGNLLTVLAPVTVSAVSPATVPAGTKTIQITVTGTGFTGTSGVSWNNNALTGVFVTSDTSLTAVITTAELAGAASNDVLVTSASGTNTPNVSDVFAVSGVPAPTATITPSSVDVGAGNTTLALTCTAPSSFTGATGFTWAIAPTPATGGIAVASATAATITIPTAYLQSVNTGTITITGGGTAIPNYVFSVLPAPPVVTGVNPKTVAISSGGTSVVISGRNLATLQSVAWDGYTFTTTDTPADLTNITNNSFSLTLPPGVTEKAATGDVIVTTPSGTSVAAPLVDTLTISGLPVITSVSPSAVQFGSAATQITITGSNFLGATVVGVSWGGAPATNVQVISANLITATLPASVLNRIETGYIQITTAAGTNGAQVGADFSVTGSLPTVTSITPNTYVEGSNTNNGVITVAGTEFDPDTNAGVISVLWNGQTYAATILSPTSLTFNVSVASPGVDNVIVNVPGVGSSVATPASDDLTVLQPIPVVTGVSPSNAAVNSGTQTLTITGSNFTGATRVTWNGVRLTNLVVVNANEITGRIPATAKTAAATADVLVTTPSGVSAANPPYDEFFVSNTVPVISSITPNIGNLGDSATTLTINGTNLSGATAVVWNGISLTNVTSVSATELTAVVPASAYEVTGTGDVLVTTTTGQSTANAPNDTYSIVAAPPVVTTVNPSSVLVGAGNTGVTITGTDFRAGATVTWNGNSLTNVTVVNTTEITATLPIADLQTAAIYPIVVTENSVSNTGISPGDLFAVTNNPPVVTSISPTTIPTGSAGTLITINGSFLGTATAVTWNGYSLPIQSIASGQVTANIPAGDLLVDAAGDVQITTNGGESSANSNDVLTVSGVVVPQIEAVAPSAVPVGAATTVVTISGSGFTGTSSVTWNGYTFTGSSISILDNGDEVAVTIPNTDLTSVASGPISLTANGNTSVVVGSAVFSVIQPAPIVTAISPSVIVNGTSQTITVYGANFTPTSQVELLDAIFGPTTYVSPNELTVQYLFPAGSVPYTADTIVIDGLSSSLTSPNDLLTVLSPITVTAITPSSANQGSPSTKIDISGTGFTGATSVTWMGNQLTGVSVNSDTDLTAVIPAADLTSVSSGDIQVTSPSGVSPLNSGDIFATLSYTPPVSNISPSSVLSGAPTTTITLTAPTGFAGATTFNWNNVYTGPVAIVNSTSATVTIPAQYLVTVVNGGSITISGATVGPFTFTVLPGLPSVTSVVPSIIPAGSGAQTVTINGANLSNVSSITWNGFTFTNAAGDILTASTTSVTFTVSAGADAEAGSGDIVVTTTSGMSATNSGDVLTIVGAPSLSSASPATVLVGSPTTVVTIAGTNLLGATSVNWNGQTFTNITGVTSSTLTVAIPSTALTTAVSGPITVTTPGGTSALPTNAVFSIVNPAPTVSAVSPTTVIQGVGAGVVTVTGTNFVRNAGFGPISVSWNGQIYPAIVVSSTTLTFYVGGSAPGSDDVIVNVPGAGSSSPNPTLDEVTVLPPVPVVTSIAPASVAAGAADTSITVTGQNLGGATAVTWNGVTLTSVTNIDNDTVTGTIPSSALTNPAVADVTVTTPSGTSQLNQPFDEFSVTAGTLPTITAVSPSSVDVGSPTTFLTLTGTNLTGATSVTWNGVQLSNVTAVNATTVTGTIPASALTAVVSSDLLVSATAGVSAANSPFDVFSVLPAPPAVTAVSPSSAVVGSPATVITVTGSGFTGATSVTWNGQPLTNVTVVNATTVTATVPASDLTLVNTSDIIVTTPSGNSAISEPADEFAVTALNPVVSAVSPSSVTVGSGTTTITVSGTNLTNASSVTWNGGTYTPQSVTSTSLKIVAYSSSLATAASGNVLVATTTGSSSANAPADVFSVIPVLPVVTSVSPSSVVEGAASATVTITGTNLSGAVAAYWNGVPLTGVTTVSSTEVTGVIPSSALTSITSGNITVTNTLGTSAITSGDVFSVIAPPPSFILSATPNTVSVDEGLTATSSIGLTDLYGYTGAPALSVSGLPTGVTAQFSTPTVSGTAASVLTFSASPTAPEGSATVTVTGTDGARIKTVQIALSVVPNQVLTSITVAPATATINTGSTQQYSAIGYDQFGTSLLTQPTFIWSVSGGETIGASTGLLTATSSGSSPFTVTATSGTVHGTASVTIDGYTVTPQSTTVTVAQGSSNSTTVSLTNVNNFSSNVALSVTGLPTGVTVQFSAPTIGIVGSSTLSFTATPLATPGSYPVSLIGVSGAFSATTTMTLVISSAQVLTSIAVTPNAVTLISGNTEQFSAVAYDQNGIAMVSQPVIEWSALSGGSISLTTGLFTAGAPGGPYTVTAASGLISGTSTVLVQGFTVAVAPTTVTAYQGNTAAGLVTLNTVEGFAGNVSLTVSGLPTGVTAAFAPSSISGSTSSVLTFTVSPTAPTVTTTVTVSGTSGALVETAPITLDVAASQVLTSITVTPSPADVLVGTTQQFAATAYDQHSVPMVTQPTFAWSTTGGGTIGASTGLFSATAVGGPFTVTATSGTVSGSVASVYVQSFTVVANPTSVSVAEGGTGTTSISLSNLSGFNSSVALSTTGLPSGVTAQYASQSISGAQTSVLTFTASPTVVAGTYTVTIQGNYSTLTKSTSVSLTIGSSQVLTSIQVSPSAPSILSGTQQQFSAKAYDQFSNLMIPQPTFTWSTNGGGTIDSSSGLFTATTAGTGSVVTATSGTVSGTAAVIVQGFTIGLQSQTATINQGSNQSIPVTLTNIGGFSGTVGLSISGLPTGVSAVFAPTSISGSNGSSLTLTVSPTAIPASTALTVTAADGSLKATTTLTITVAPQTILTSITVLPPSVTLNLGGTQPYSATGYDQYSIALVNQPTFTWSASGGSIDPASGIFSATAGGQFTVSATAGGVTGSTSVTVQRVPVIISFSPTSGPVGTTVTVTGANLGSASNVIFDGSVPATIVSNTSTQIVITVPFGATTSTIVVGTPYGTAASTGTFTVTPTVPLPVAASPTISPNGGAFNSSVSVTLSDTTSGANIYYTIDGSTPTTGSTQYTGAFTLTSSATVNAIAVATGYTNSPVASASITVTLPVIASYSAGLQLISLPGTYTGVPLDTIFGYSNVTLAVWDPLGQNYDLTPYAPANAITDGQGYWVRFPQNVSVTLPGTSPSGTVHISLQAGWNMIGDPFNSAVDLDNLTFNGGTVSFAAATGSNQLIGSALYAYDQATNSYVSATELDPGVGYWMFAYKATDLDVPQP